MGEPAQEVLARTELAQQQSELALARSEHAEERAKLERERAELELSRSFATRHAGVLITAIASVMAVAVTSIVSYNQRRTQIDTEDIRKDREIEISSEGHERQWKLALLNYMTDNLDKILAIGSEKPNPILEMISATFEEKYTAPLFQGLEATADSDKKGRWRRAQGYVFQKSEASPDPPPLENQEVEAFLEKPQKPSMGRTDGGRVMPLRLKPPMILASTKELSTHLSPASLIAKALRPIASICTSPPR